MRLLIFRCSVFSLALFIFFSAISCQSEVTFNCQDCWKAEISDSLVAPYCDKPLNFYIDSITSYADLRGTDHVLRSIGDKVNTFFSLNIDTVGLLNGSPVLDIIFKLGTREQHLVGKTILIEASKSRFHLLYVVVREMGEFFPKRSQIYHFASHEILSTKSRFGGQMVTYSAERWTWDTIGNYPCRLTFGFSFQELFDQDIKKDWKSSLIGSLDLDSLYFWAYVELPGDHYRWPTGGKIWTKLGIHSCEFVVVDKGFDSTDIAPH